MVFGMEGKLKMKNLKFKRDFLLKQGLFHAGVYFKVCHLTQRFISRKGRRGAEDRKKGFVLFDLNWISIIDFFSVDYLTPLSILNRLFSNLFTRRFLLIQ
jgi:hypothetical protein